MGQILTVVETVVVDEETGATTTKVTAYSIQDEAGTLKEIGTDAAYDDSDIMARIVANEDAIAILNGDSTIVGSVDKKVADKVTEEINAFVTKLSDDDTVNTFKELVDYVADHGTEAANMAKDISDLQQAVANKVDKEEGKGLSANDLTDTLLDKINNIAEGAQVNVIDSVDGAQFALDDKKHLTLLDIAMSKVTGLQSALDNKVDKVTGQSLVSDELISKLEAIEVGAQVNKIETIKLGESDLDISDKTVVIPVGAGLKQSEEITIAEDGTLGVGTISIDKITQDEGMTLILDGGTSSI